MSPKKAKEHRYRARYFNSEAVGGVKIPISVLGSKFLPRRITRAVGLSIQPWCAVRGTNEAENNVDKGK